MANERQKVDPIYSDTAYDDAFKTARRDSDYDIDTLQCRVYNTEYRDNMIRTFIEVPIFSKRWKEIGLGEDELLHLQIMLLKDPQSGPVMEGTGGIRKVRFPLENKGKSGSVRVCYTDFEEYEVIYLITAFTKDEQQNLTKDEKNALKKLVKALKKEAAASRR